MEELKKKLEMDIMLKNPFVEIKEFSQMVTNCPRNVSIKAVHDNYEVDAKSILGLYNLDLSKPFKLVFNSVCGYEDFLHNFDKWRV